MKSDYKFLLIAMAAVSFFLFFTMSCKDNPADPEDPYETSIAGVILDNQDQPLPEALVEAYEDGNTIQSATASDITDEEGKFKLENLPEDLSKVTIRVKHDHFQTFEANLEQIVAGGSKDNLPIKMMSQDSCCGTIEMVVKDEDGEALNKVKVQLKDQQKTYRVGKTNEDGYLKFEEVCDGEFYLRLVKDEYKVIEQELVIEPCDSLEFAFEMESLGGGDSCCDGKIYFFVKDEDTEDPIKAVTVKLYDGDNKIRIGSTDESGKVVFEEICEGDDYLIHYAKNGYGEAEYDFVMECNDTLEFHKTMKSKKDSCCDGVLKVKVQNEDEEALKEAEVKLWYDGGYIEKLFTNGDGFVIFDGLCEGNYAIRVYKKDYKVLEKEIEIPCNETVEKTVTLLSDKDSCCEGVIKIITRDEDEKLVKNAQVKLWQGGKLLEKVLSGEDGVSIFDGVCEGKYAISIIHEQYKHQEFELEIGCNEEVEKIRTLVMEKDTCCEGVIKIYAFDKDEKPIKKAKVKIWKDGKLLEEAKTNEAGLAIFDGICEGKYGVDIIHENYKDIEFMLEVGCNEEVVVEKFLESGDDCCEGVLKVKVRNENEEALKEAEVKLWYKGEYEKLYTNGDGVVIFDGLCEGVYGLRIYKKGYKVQEKELEIPCNETVEKTITLVADDDCCEGKIYIIPRDKNTNEVIKNATVKLWFGGKLLKTKSAEKGFALFEELCEGKYGVDIIAEGYKAIEFNLELGCNKTLEETRLLEPKEEDDTCCTAKIKVHVFDKEELEELENATVKVYLGEKVIREAKTDKNGWVEFEEICAPAKYGILVSHEQYQAEDFSFTFEKCVTKQETIKLKKKE